MKRKSPLICIFAAAGAFWMLICAGSYVFMANRSPKPHPAIPAFVSASQSNFSKSKQISKDNSADQLRFSSLICDEYGSSIFKSDFRPGPASISLFQGRFPCPSSDLRDEVLENEIFFREQLLGKLQKRADQFQKTAQAGRLPKAEALQIVRDGWRTVTQANRFSETQTYSGTRLPITSISETEFLLQALAQLEPGESVDRARIFALKDCASCGTQLTFTTAEQFRLAAVGKSLDVSHWTESFCESQVLSRWQSVSEQICAWQTDRTPNRVPNPYRSFPHLTASVSSGPISEVLNLLAISMQTQNPLDSFCLSPQDRMPETTIFRLTGSMSAGHRPVLLI